MRYFDHNATHRLSQTAKAAWLDAVEKLPGNPSSPHRLGSRSDAALQRAREQLADILGCRPFDIVWTSGATESNNAIIAHLARESAGEMLISSIEHPCVFGAAKRWLNDRFRTIPVTRDGVVDMEWIVQALRENKPAAVVLMAANNETGVIQPWADVQKLCHAARTPFFCDAAQWLGKNAAAGLGQCDFISGCAHKFGGPAGVGFIKCTPNFRPLLEGGPQEDGRRAGTENVAGAISMVAALAEREKAIADGALADRKRWRDDFERTLKATLPGVEIIGTSASRLWNTSAVLMPELADCRKRWVVKLDKLGFAVSTGSACSSGKEQPSHVLAAMGYAPNESDRMLRFSAGWDTTEEDWKLLANAVLRASAEMK